MNSSVFIGESVGFDVHGTLLRSSVDSIYEKFHAFRDVCHRFSDSAIFVIMATIMANRNEYVIGRAVYHKKNGSKITLITDVSEKHKKLFKTLLAFKGIDFYDDIIMRGDSEKSKLFKLGSIQKENVKIFYENDPEIIYHIEHNTTCRVIKIGG